MDAVIDGQSRHHPLASGMPVGRGRVRVIQLEASADGVGDGLEHVGTADSRTPYGKLALAVRGHDVKIAVTVNILQGILDTVDAVSCGESGIGRNLDTYNRDIDRYGKRGVHGFRSRCGLVNL